MKLIPKLSNNQLLIVVVVAVLAFVYFVYSQRMNWNYQPAEGTTSSLQKVGR